MPIAVPLRHELKYYINPVEYHLLSHALDQVLERDPNGDPEFKRDQSVRCILTHYISLADKLMASKTVISTSIRIYIARIN